MTGPLNSLHYAVGPVVAVLVVIGLGFVSRWAFSPTRDQRRRREAARRQDFGLLVPVRTAPTRQDAERLRAVLAEHDIRATASELPPGPVRVTADGRVRPTPKRNWQVLVFERDVERARRLVDPTG